MSTRRRNPDEWDGRPAWGRDYAWIGVGLAVGCIGAVLLASIGISYIIKGTLGPW